MKCSNAGTMASFLISTQYCLPISSASSGDTSRPKATPLRNVINSMMEKHSGYCGIFVGDENGYNYVVGSKNKDCKEIAGKLKDEFSAKGGGNSQMIQGSLVASANDISTVFNATI